MNVVAVTNSLVEENVTWFQLSLLTTSWNLCSTCSLMLDGSRPMPSWDRSGIRTVRITRSELLTSRSRPLLARRSRMTTPLQSRMEWIVVHVSVSMMLIHPFEVPAMMWFPNAVKIETHVECFASCAACFAATAGSTSSPSLGWGRSGAEGRMRLIGFGEATSTRTGWSSKREATKRRLTMELARSHCNVPNKGICTG